MQNVEWDAPKIEESQYGRNLLSMKRSCILTVFINYYVYLNCTFFFFCSVTEQVERAFHLALAVLLGETVYNFGELVRSYLLQ